MTGKDDEKPNAANEDAKADASADEQSRKTQAKLALHKMVPNMLTISAMCAGMSAIQYAIAEKWQIAVLAIIVAALLDGLDGAAARLLRAQSKLGAELDSLSDFLCFGVAPALMLHLWSLHHAGRAGWIVALAFSVAVGLRLARFNAAAKDESLKTASAQQGYFTGVPSPCGAGLAIMPLVVTFLLKDYGLEWPFLSHPGFVAAWTLLIAVLLVSRIPTFSSKQIHLPHKFVIPALAAFGVLAAGLINATWETLTLMGAAYSASIFVSVWCASRAAEAGLLETIAGTTQPDDEEI